MEEAQGLEALLNLEDHKYSVEQIAAKMGLQFLCGRGPQGCLWKSTNTSAA